MRTGKDIQEFHIGVTFLQIDETYNGEHDNWYYFTSSCELSGDYYNYYASFKRGMMRFHVYFHKHLPRNPTKAQATNLVRVVHEYITTGRNTIESFWR